MIFTSKLLLLYLQKLDKRIFENERRKRNIGRDDHSQTESRAAIEKQLL